MTDETPAERSPCVLLVEDDDAIRRSTALSLEMSGMQVLQAADGESALQVFSARSAEVDCVLLDLGLPRLSGEETFEALLAIDAGACIVLATGSIEEETLERLRTRGARSIVRKPSTIDEIHDALIRAMRPADPDHAA